MKQLPETKIVSNPSVIELQCHCWQKLKKKMKMKDLMRRNSLEQIHKLWWVQWSTEGGRIWPKPKFFYYLAFGFGYQSFILSIWPSASAESEIAASVILCIELSCIVLPVNKKWKRILWTELRIDGEVYIILNWY